MSTRTSSLSMRTTSPSTMSPSLKSMRTLSSTGTISPFSSRKKSFMVSSRDMLVVSVMYWLLSFFLRLPVQIIQFYAGGVRNGFPPAATTGTRRFSQRFDLAPALPGLDLDLERRLKVVGRDHPVGC